jgi:hypothetical protein
MCDFRDVIAFKLNFDTSFNYFGALLSLEEVRNLQKKPQNFDNTLYRIVWHYITVAKKIAIEYRFFSLPEYIKLPQELPITTIPQAAPCSSHLG